MIVRGDEHVPTLHQLVERVAGRTTASVQIPDVRKKKEHRPDYRRVRFDRPSNGCDVGAFVLIPGL